MGQADTDRSEVAAARSRMTDIAVELAHRAEPDHLKEIAREKAEDLKELAKEKAEDLKVMAKDKAHEQVAEMKGLAKEKAMQKTYELRDQFVESKSRPYVGAALGASIGWMLFQKLLGRKHKTSTTVGITPITPYTERSYVGSTGVYDAGYVGVSDSGYAATGGYTEDFYGVDQPAPSTIAVEGSDSSFGLSTEEQGPGVKERAVGAVSGAKDRAAGAMHSATAKVGDVAANAKQRAASVASNVRDRVPAPAEVRERGAAWYHRGLEEQPVLFALGALAIGMLASMLIPVSSRERALVAPAKAKMMEPALAKAQAAIENLGHIAEEKLSTQQPVVAQNEPSAIIASTSLTDDPMAKDEFGMGIPDPQAFPSTH